MDKKLFTGKDLMDWFNNKKDFDPTLPVIEREVKSITKMNRLLKYAASDLHGMYHNRFVPTLKKYGLIDDDLNWVSGYRIIFCGDYVDGGLNGYETLKLIKKFCDEGHAIALMGNHDALSAALAWFHQQRGYYHPGWKRSFDANGGRLQDLVALTEDVELTTWLRQLPLTHIENEVLYQHSDMFYYGLVADQMVTRFGHYKNPELLFDLWCFLTDGRRWEGNKPKDVLQYLERMGCTNLVHGHTHEQYQVSWNKQANIHNINDYPYRQELWSLDQKFDKKC